MFKIDFETHVTLTAVFMGIGISFLLYLNRFEPKLIKLNDDYVEITYYEQRYFGRPVGNYVKSDIKALKEDNTLILSFDNAKIATIKRKALDTGKS